MTQTITVIRGDGIGPEIMDATLFVLDALQAGLTYEYADAGLVALEKHGDLLPESTLASITKNKVALKSPLTTPVGEASARSTSPCVASSTCTPTCVRPSRSPTPSRVSPMAWT
ncbi:hypothetical protein XPR_0616 [Xanthomonas arboricola pv. pruni MAFF 301420]|uniref:Isopropylmalate dehydrogenase-like domain-containing protein n=2 Tax=Xanthomonas arboricola pv. pruni TaxID=69929 RepID=W4SBW1_9XANT|nr:isocitrate dehydrogenase [Xanthomonas arboricola pv. pruni str. MAFF 311562]GAE53981.1 hypothetical protein XPR_0616 [Xanthomonas arboricola pv. pruni MAFF 301420]GAE58768.1 hypothetical protein XPN_0674 [Xanthomonas arboricola pv. pruni MAFF 301427]